MHFANVVQMCRGELWTVSESAREVYDLHWIYGTDAAGLSPSREYIHTGKNSGYQAIGLAYLFGARRITLLGYDYSTGLRGECHWHGNHPKGLGNGGVNRYGAWVQAMGPLARDLSTKGVQVLNASRRTALKCFRRVTLETALNGLRNTDGIGNGGSVPHVIDCTVR